MEKKEETTKWAFLFFIFFKGVAFERRGACADVDRPDISSLEKDINFGICEPLVYADQ